MTTKKICKLFIDASSIAPWQLYSVLVNLKESGYTTSRKLYVGSDQQFTVWQPFLSKLKLEVIRYSPQGENSLEIQMALDVGAAVIQNKKLNTVAIVSSKKSSGCNSDRR